MSWILGIDTSSIDMGIGLYNGITAVASYSRYVKNSHAEHITQITDMILSTNQVPPHEVCHVAVSTGPGSFTGLRIGIAFAKGFCIGRPAYICPVSSLLVLAHGARYHTGRVLAAIDGRNDEVFWASFSSDRGILSRISDDIVSSSGDFKGNIKDDDVIITDTMGYLRSTVFDFLEGRNDVFPVERFPIQRGFYCAHIGASLLENQNSWKDGLEILPDYLRLSAARQVSVKGSPT